MENLTELYCLMDDFCKDFEPKMHEILLNNGSKRRRRSTQLSLAEMMTLVVLFHQLRFSQFKVFYLYHVRLYLRKEFPNLPSYSRCVELLPRSALALTALSVADSTPIAVCDNLRIRRHKVFDGIAERGKTSTGWFFGFKLHVIINQLGEILSFRLTPGNTDDRKPLPELIKDLSSCLYADKGYLSASLKQQLKTMGINLITNIKKKMKPVEQTYFDKAILRHRSVIETVFDELKNLCQIESIRGTALLLTL